MNTVNIYSLTYFFGEIFLISIDTFQNLTSSQALILKENFRQENHPEKITRILK